MAFTEDLSLFFDVAEGFAVDAVFGLDAGDQTFAVIFHDPTQGVEMLETHVDASAPFLMMQESDLEGVRRGISCDVQGDSYRVERITRDGTGLATVYLS